MKARGWGSVHGAGQGQGPAGRHPRRPGAPPLRPRAGGAGARRRRPPRRPRRPPRRPGPSVAAGARQARLPAGAAGPPRMGSPEGEGSNHERPQHQVERPESRIGRWPATIAHYRTQVEASGHRTPDGGSPPGKANHPAARVARHDARADTDRMEPRLQPPPGSRDGAPAPAGPGNRGVSRPLATRSRGFSRPFPTWSGDFSRPLDRPTSVGHPPPRQPRRPQPRSIQNRGASAIERE